MTLTTSYYDLLGVEPCADEEAVRTAYRKLARRHHPDVSKDPRAHEHMARINEAFETLTNPMLRGEYDASLGTGGLKTAPAPSDEVPNAPVKVKFIKRLEAHRTPVYALTFFPDSGQVVSSAFDNEIIWWDEETGSPKRKVKLDSGTISTLRAFENDRLVAAGCAESQVSMYKLAGSKVEAWRTSQEEWVGAVSISPDGKALASGSLLHSVSVNSASDGANVFRKQEHASAITAVAWSADGHFVATGSADADVRLWNGSTGTVVGSLNQVRSTVTALAFSGDGRYLAVAAVDLSLRVFALSNGELVKMMYGHEKPVESLSFHPNSWLVASGSRDGSVGLWNAAKGIGNLRIEVSSRPVHCVAFSNCGGRLAACGQDKIVRLWEVTAQHTA